MYATEYYHQEIKRLNKKIAELEREVCELIDEVDDWKGKYHDLEVETEQMMQEHGL